MFQKVKGIVLRETEYKDSDKILTLLTDQAGLMTVRAWGVKRKNSPLKSGCQLFAYSEFTVQEKQGFRRVQEAVPIELFSALRGDIELLSLASYFAQATEVLAQEDCPDTELLSLVLHTMNALCVGKEQQLVKAAFELRLAALSGYEPDFSSCASCGVEEVEYFDVTHGTMLCGNCKRLATDGLRMPISLGTLQALRYAVTCEIKKLFAFTLGESALKEFAGVAEAYLLSQLERGFYTLDFYKSLLLT